jgi:sugar/nucleoside kinase (ribokinase family)
VKFGSYLFRRVAGGYDGKQGGSGFEIIPYVSGRRRGNVAVGAAKLGLKTGVISKVGDDLVG